MTMFHFSASVLLLLAYHGDGTSDLPPATTRPLLHGKQGTLRLGVTGLEPLHGFEDFPAWRRFFDAWISRVLGPFVPERVRPTERRYYDNTATMTDANGTRWTKNTRTQFNVTLSDETIDRLGVALGLGVSPTHVEVVLTRDLLHESQLKYVLPGLNNVDAYVILVESSSDVAQSRASFLRYDKDVVSHHLHASKWASRKRREGSDCEYDVWKKAFDTMNRTGGSLTKVNWSESERRVLDRYDLRSMKPAIFIVNVSRDYYIHQDPAFVASTEEWVHESLIGEARSPVILTSVELEEELAMRTPSRGRDAESVFDVILRNVFRYFRLTRFYAIRGNNLRSWYIPENTPAFLVAGVVFHRACTQCNKWQECISEYCTTHYDHFNRTAEEHLSSVGVGHAGDIASANVTLGEKQFVSKDRYYRIKEDDVLRFTMSSKAFKEPEDQCTGFEDTRPLLLHPVGHEVRICIAGLTNTGKTTLFNNLTGSHADVSPEVFTTRRIMERSMEMADDRFRWLANHFPTASLRPSKVTYVDTPALLQDYDDHCELLNVAPWKHELYEALKKCDFIYLVSKEFNDTFVELWEGDHHDQHSCSEGSGFKGSDIAAYKLMRTQDWKVLAELRDNATLRNDLDELDALNTIEENFRGYNRSGKQHGFPDFFTDERVRYHDWNEKELAVLERTRFLSSKPIVYVLNMDEADSANASSTTLPEARKYFKSNDRDAMVLPFAGQRYSTRNASFLFGIGEPTGATTFLEKTLAHYQLAHFYTASHDLVAAWTFKLGTTYGEAVGLVNATLEPNVTDVEVASMREVITAGSVEKAHRLGAFRRRPLEEEVEDGDLLVLSPGELHEAIGEVADSMATSATRLPRTRPAAPTGEKGHDTSYWIYFLSACNLVQFAALLAAFVLLSDQNRLDRVRTFVRTHLRRRGDRGERQGEALLGDVSYAADSESISVR